jgi:hypothetical protein
MKEREEAEVRQRAEEARVEAGGKWQEVAGRVWKQAKGEERE